MKTKELKTVPSQLLSINYMKTKELETVPSQQKHENKDLKMDIIQKVCCPNCGSKCERHYICESQICRTSCASCDYLMINCTRTGKVIEAYAPGIYASK